jgi:hypothetical protein
MAMQLRTLLVMLLLFGFANLTQATPILLDSGERAIFTFDFSGLDISAANAFEFQLDTTLADGSPFLYFDLDFNLYDELGDAAISSCCGSSFVSPTLLIGVGAYAALYDDPINYLELGFNEVEGIAPTTVRMSVTASAYTNTSPNGQFIARVAGVPSIVPVPATFALLFVALAGLILTRTTPSVSARSPANQVFSQLTSARA